MTPFKYDLINNERLHRLVLLGVGEGEELGPVQATVTVPVSRQEQVPAHRRRIKTE